MPRLPIAMNLFRTSALLAGALALGACSTIDGFLQGDKVDYKTRAAKNAPLDVPPDLTQLQRDGRYAPQAGIVSASAYQAGSPAAAQGAVALATTVAPNAVGDMRIVREGNQRWLFVPLPPEALWPQLRAFWQERGFSLLVDTPEAGVMETDWAENRAKLPQDIVRRTLGRVFDSLYDTGERDRYRLRVERTAAGSEVYVTHRGMVETYTTDKRDQTVWTARPADPQMEAEILSRLMVKLGAKEAQAREATAKPAVTAVAGTPAATVAATGPARARAIAGQPGALQVDEGFDRAWRRVGVALDRSGFTVEDRDRAGGLYFVRYADPKNADRAEPSFFAKLFSFGKTDAASAPQRYRIALKAAGDKTGIAVQNSQGGAESGEIAQRIVAVLIEELK